MTQQASETMHPTDDELEAMAKKLLTVDRNFAELLPAHAEEICEEAAAMLRACKGGASPDARREAWRAGMLDAASLLRRVADGYEAGGDAAIACGLRLTEGNVRALAQKGPTDGG